MSRKERHGIFRDVRDLVGTGRRVDALAADPDAAEGEGAETRDPAEAFGNIAGKIAGLQGRALRLAAAGLAAAAALLIAFTLATAGFGGGADTPSGGPAGDGEAAPGIDETGGGAAGVGGSETGSGGGDLG